MTCALTFAPAHLSPADEKARYATHRNSPADAGYRAFLDRVLAPLCAVLPKGAAGLDFGCGPGPTASAMLRERGFSCADWDPFFAPGEGAPPAGPHDFVVATEVFEHLRRPAEELERLDALLKPGGVLAVLTGVLEDDAAFPDWWYHKDPTHIAFWRPETLAWAAKSRGWSLERPAKDAALFRKPA